ncbi:glutathione S-transferase N-terminal domain-containing protein [Shewanella sp. NIFS-20-20]|uniref:glutathione S-transferase N-terminal domain-containing protein n=1 Tax=Shewanella sp. NIFS-20-20 TaxID=2853806 RepID=UPI001C46BF8B|nr:glutathione S-transferase N-terminal domain-containing protein [Shewanella sp. NIFS-20-20]MBV7316594.1 glutathione S-transferase N-terminal domain-containing protein [Shewanella sp. NIFS-20-20]
MKLVRFLLGKLILLLNAVFKPKQQSRSPQEQQTIDAATAALTLYQYPACPFCVKVRRQMHRQKLNIQLQDAKIAEHAETLRQQGGHLKVPCLRIEQAGKIQWLYESNDIISYLKQHYA